MRSVVSIIIAVMTVIAVPAFAQQQTPVSVVQVAIVSETELAPTVAVPGTVYSRNEMQITAGVGGQLTMVAEPGTFVAEGQTIARVDNRTLSLQRDEQSALLARARISVRQLQSQLLRQTELADSNLVSEFELEQSTANRDLAMSDASIIRVRVQQIDDQIRRAEVKAPFSGVVISRTRRAGEDVARGAVLGQLTDLKNMEVRAFVPLKHLPRTVVGDQISVFTNAARLVGRIRSLVPTGDVRSQTFEARIELPLNAAADWTVGQLVSVAVPIRARSMELVVPRDALVLRNNGSFVFRVNSDNVAEQIAVAIGNSSGMMIAVEGTLQVGDRVAIRGAENLREGSAVKIILSGSTSPAAAAAES